jgi:hypothetical protein
MAMMHIICVGWLVGNRAPETHMTHPTKTKTSHIPSGLQRHQPGITTTKRVAARQLTSLTRTTVCPFHTLRPAVFFPWLKKGDFGKVSSEYLFSFPNFCRAMAD